MADVDSTGGPGEGGKGKQSGDTPPRELSGAQHALAANVLSSTCGLIMPISACDGCDERHWEEVRLVLAEVAAAQGYRAQLVSDSNSVAIIQKAIVTNLYSFPLVICDVSGRNSNVMFELGLRLSFNKPTIVIKDDVTPYSFDIGPYRQIDYPRDFNYWDIIKFKDVLGAAISSIMNDDKSGHRQGYLESFGPIQEVRLSSEKVDEAQFIQQNLAEIRQDMRRIMEVIGYPVPSTSAVRFSLGGRRAGGGQGARSEIDGFEATGRDARSVLIVLDRKLSSKERAVILENMRSTINQSGSDSASIVHDDRLHVEFQSPEDARKFLLETAKSIEGVGFATLV